MMKKLLFFLAVGVVANTAIAQKIESNGVKPFAAYYSQPEDVKLDIQAIIKDKAEMHAKRAAGKTTLDGKRMHSYLDYLVAAGNTINGSLPYMWFGADMFAIYSGATQGTFERDTVNFVSYGTVVHPSFTGYNDPALPNSQGSVYIANYNNYTVDSAYVYGVYGRNSTKTSVVDTMIISMVYGGPNIRQFSFGGANYNVDTVRTAAVRYDQVNRTADTFGTGNPLVVTRKIPLTTTSRNDSTSNGFTIVRAAFNTPIPAGNVVAITATFKTGEAYTPYSDTIFRGSLNAAEPFKYNMWRPIIYQQNENQFPTYTPGNRNTGVFKLLGDSTNGYSDYYVPTFAYINAEARLEFPDIDVLLSCVGCGGVDIANVPNNIKNLGAYPNPATNEVSIPFSLTNAADVQVTLSAITGQVIKTQDMGNVSGGTAVFSTTDVANGMYIYTIKADNLTQSGRVTVAH